jgi:hypothetical protein
MMDSSLRYFGCAMGFAFGLVWMTVGLGSAILCLVLGGLAYGAVFVAERAQANARTRQTGSDAPVLSLDEFELDDDELQDDATSALAAEADYGWPLEEPEIAHSAGR